MKKLFILGLDCATPQLIFDNYLKELPTIRGLISEKKYGKLKSTIPPVTVPAWMSMMTGKDPGQLGFYGFTDRSDFSYNKKHVVTSNFVKEKTIWDYAGENGLKSIVFNLPLTYPPKKINGILISSFLTPDRELQFTYPKSIKDEINSISNGDYKIDVDNFRTQDKSELRSELYNIAKNRFKIMRYLIKNKEWDLFIGVEMGIDRIHHAFWSSCFSDHELYKRGNEFEDTIVNYYKFIDNEISKLIECFDDDTELMIVSDHGAKTLKGTFFINDWLIKNGFLKLKKDVNATLPLKTNLIDWGKTVAWASGGYYGKIYLNISGREPQGIIKREDVEKSKKEIISELTSLKGPSEEAISNKLFDISKIYTETKGHPPDLFLYVGNLDWRVSSRIGNSSLFLNEKTNIDNANHDVNGIFIYSNKPKSAIKSYSDSDRNIKKIKQFSIYDIAPTALNILNINIPNDFRGNKILEKSFTYR